MVSNILCLSRTGSCSKIIVKYDFKSNLQQRFPFTFPSCGPLSLRAYLEFQPVSRLQSFLNVRAQEVRILITMSTNYTGCNYKIVWTQSDAYTPVPCAYGSNGLVVICSITLQDILL